MPARADSVLEMLCSVQPAPCVTMALLLLSPYAAVCLGQCGDEALIIGTNS